MSLRRKFLRLCSKLWPLLASVFVVLVFFYPVWLKKLVPLPADFIVGVYYPWLDYKWGFSTGVPVKNPITTDVVSFIYPVQMLAIDLLKAGQFPLWNPYIFTGSPLLANFQSAPFSPTNFLYFLFDSLTAWSIQIMAQHFLAIVFTFLLLRYWNVSKLGALFGGLVFGFSGFNLIWSQWNGHTLTASCFYPSYFTFCRQMAPDASHHFWNSSILVFVFPDFFRISPGSALHLNSKHGFMGNKIRI